MLRSIRIIFALLSVGFVFTLVQAQQPNTDALRWRYIGPVGNRVTSIGGVPGQTYVYYAGSAAGGIFKTIEGGIHWEPGCDGQPGASIGSLALGAGDAMLVLAVPG